MKAIKAFGKHDLRQVNLSDPVASNDDVVVSVRACGICGSDKWFWDVNEPTDYIAGHEVAGIVTAVGPGVKQLVVGDRVAVNNVRGCGSCSACKHGEFVKCSQPVVHMGHGFSEQVVVPERNCLILYNEISYQEGCLIFDNWGTPYSALKSVPVETGHTVIVSGCGPIGLAAIALLKNRGAKIVAIDPIDERRQAALRCGAILTISPDEDVKGAVNRLSEGVGASVFVECSGKSTMYTSGISCLTIGGWVVSIGEGAEIVVGSSILIHRHLTITGSLYSSMIDGQVIQDMMVQKQIEPLSLVTHQFRLEELPSVFGMVVSGSRGLLKSMVVADGGSELCD